MDRRVSELSGGEKRRAHAAVALLGHPKLLLLDEPTAGADVLTRRAILTAVKEAASDGKAVCYCTHYLHEVEELDAGVSVLNAGKVVKTGRVGDFIRRAHDSTVVVELSQPVWDSVLADHRWPAVEVKGCAVRILSASPVQVAREVLDLLEGQPDVAVVSLEIERQTLEGAVLSMIASADDGARADGEVPEASGATI
jgi:ABC-2 type transport system ATP-binding protein